MAMAMAVARGVAASPRPGKARPTVLDLPDLLDPWGGLEPGGLEPETCSWTGHWVTGPRQARCEARGPLGRGGADSRR